MTKKKKQSGSSDLRSLPIQLSLHKYTNLPLLRAQSKQHLNVDYLQPFFPPIECLFKSENLEFVNEYGIKYKDEVQGILAADKVRTVSGIQDMHIKKTMLLSPVKWMQGEYGSSLGLPTSNEQATSIQTKLQNYNNSAYVGSIISSVLSESGCLHFPKVYGVFTGTAGSHTVDISDDYEELSDRSWFSQNIGKTFELKLSEHISQFTEFQHTRVARPHLHLGEEMVLDNVEELDTEHIESAMGDLSLMQNEIEMMSEEDISDDSSTISTAYIFAIESCDCDEEEREILDEEEEEGESFAWATFTNVPVQLTLMEKCEDTLYSLMVEQNDSEKHLAWLTQVIFALAYAQRNFGFVHNDLHSNNVMYVKTDKEFLYYTYAGVTYKVPTYGYLIKIIDFERGLMSVKLNGMKEPKFFMSDHFSVNEEAAGQYNYPPFYVHKVQEIKPNASFDLIRLTTSLFWDFFPEGPLHSEYANNAVFCLFMKWLTLEDGTSILFGKHEPRHDRYHGFTLYKAITRYCKDTAVPRKELLSLKSFYEIPVLPIGENALAIEN